MSNEAVKQAVDATKEVVKAAKDAGVQDKLIQMLDSLQNGAVTIGHEVVKYSPDVANAALMVVRINGIQALAAGLTSAVAAIIAYHWTKSLWAWAIGVVRDDSDFFPAFIVPIACGVVCFLISNVAVNHLTNVWSYIAIAEPKLWLANELINSVLNK